MTVSELKAAVTATGSKHFERSTMKFFGDTIANYGCRKAAIETSTGVKPVYVLYRKRPVNGGLRGNAYFCQTSFERVWPSVNAQVNEENS